MKHDPWAIDAFEEQEAKRFCFFGGGGGGGESQTTTTQPPAYALPSLRYLTRRAESLARNDRLQFYPGQTYAGQAPETLQALGLQAERATAGSPLIGAAQGQLYDTLSGRYLDPTSNPAFQKGAQDIRAQVGGMFSSAGRYGSGAMANQATEAMSDLAARTYESERQRQIQGMLFAPQLANQDYYDIARLAEVGGAREGFDQKGIDEAMARFNFGEMEPWQRLQMFQGLISGIPGSVTTTGGMPGAQTGFSGAGLLGGGAAGAGIATAAGLSQPWLWPMIAGGALLGGFL